MTAEQLKQFQGALQEALKPIKSDLDAKYKEGEEKRTEEHQARITQLEALQGQYEEAITELQKHIDRKEIPPEEQEKEHKFTQFNHFLHDLFKAGPGGRDETDELKTWRESCEEKAGSPSQSAGEAESGGYLIPTEYAEQVLERAMERSDILSRAMVIPMATNKIDIPFLDGFDESQGKVAGNVIWYWKGEEDQYTATDIKLGNVELNLHKCTGLAYMTNEILKFSRPSIEPLVRRAFDVGLNRAITKACIRGTGAGSPLGVLNANCAIEVGKETGQTADTFVFENALNMLARLYSEDESIGDAVWHCNKQLLPQLGVMSVSVGTGGSAIFVNSAQEAPDFRLMGLPLRFSSQMSAIGDSGDAMLNDWRQYLIGQPTGQANAELTQSIHLKFDYDQTAYKFVFYMDGQPWWKEAFIPLYGDTQSPFVKLEAR